MRPEEFEHDGVRFWYATAGDESAAPLVLLHPGGVDARAYEPNLAALGQHFHLWLPERRGHGHVVDTGEFSFETDAHDTIAFLERIVGEPVRLLGCSAGGVVALRVAALRPDLVERLVVIAAPFHHDGWAPGVLAEQDEAPPDLLADTYAEVSPHGREHYPVAMRKFAAALRREPVMTTEQLSALAVRTLVMLGDDDEVSLEHAVAMVRALPAGELAVVPGTSHGLLWEKPELCAALLLDFLTRDAVQTFAPRRRG